MNIYDYAMQMELDSEKYYRELAGNCTDVGLKTILTMLGDEEAKHYRILRQMKAGQFQSIESQLLSNAKNIFAKMKAPAEQIYAASQIDLYKKAQDIEKKAEAFYREKAAEEKGQAKDMLLKIAAQENKHYALLEGIIQFVSRPQVWVEAAEWSHLGETY